MMKCLIVALCILAGSVEAGENLNGIYLGGDVSDYKAKVVAVQITEDGTVIAYRGIEVPFMHDRWGRPVKIRKVELR